MYEEGDGLLFSLEMDTFLNFLESDNDVTPLDLEQKKSVLLFLYMITVICFPKAEQELKILFIEQCAKDFEVGMVDCVPYLDTIGGLGIVNVLKSLPDLQKEFLMMLVFEYANCNGVPTEKELLVIGNHLKIVGYTEKIIIQMMYKSQMIGKLLL